MSSLDPIAGNNDALVREGLAQMGVANQVFSAAVDSALGAEAQAATAKHSPAAIAPLQRPITG